MTTDNISADDLEKLAAHVRAHMPNDRLNAAFAVGLIAANVMIACGLKDNQAHTVFSGCLSQMRRNMPSNSCAAPTKETPHD